MDHDDIVRVVKALDAALVVLRDAEGRRSADDLRLQSMIAAARATLAERIVPPAGNSSASTASPLFVDGIPLRAQPPKRPTP